MSDLTRQPRTNLPAAAAPQEQSRSRKVAESLTAIEATLLAPQRRFGLLRADYPDTYKHIERYRGVKREAVERITNEPDRQQAMANAKAALAGLPPHRELRSIIQNLLRLDEQEFDLRQTRVIVGLMIDSFPNARPHSPEVFLESLVHQLRTAAICPAAVATACDEILRIAKFVPTIGEVLEKAREAEATISRRFKAVLDVQDVVMRVTDLVVALEGLEGLPAERPAVASVHEKPWTPGEEIPF